MSAKLKVGTKVWYSTYSGKRVKAVVTGFGEKNDQPVIDVRVYGSKQEYWGYPGQVELRINYRGWSRR